MMMGLQAPHAGPSLIREGPDGRGGMARVLQGVRPVRAVVPPPPSVCVCVTVCV